MMRHEQTVEKRAASLEKTCRCRLTPAITCAPQPGAAFATNAKAVTDKARQRASRCYAASSTAFLIGCGNAMATKYSRGYR
jgi:hypothetical protein